MRGESWMLLVEVECHDFEIDRCMGAQAEQHVEQAIAVLAAGQAYHDAIAGSNHVEVCNRLPGEAAQALLQFVRFVLLSLRIHRSHKWMLRPPSTAMTWPVM